MAWTARSEVVPGRQGIRVTIDAGSLPLTRGETLLLLREDAGFRSMFMKALADVPFEAFRWETPPLTSATLGRPFECVLLDSPGLASKPSPEAFAAHFGPEASARGVVEFANLGKDAILVVPAPQGPTSAYGHLAAFLRNGPEGQRHALWQLVGDAMKRRVAKVPVWLSTAGAGVPWLHVRLDDRPKYYGFPPYRSEE